MKLDNYIFEWRPDTPEELYKIFEYELGSYDWWLKEFATKIKDLAKKKWLNLNKERLKSLDDFVDEIENEPLFDHDDCIDWFFPYSSLLYWENIYADYISNWHKKIKILFISRFIDIFDVFFENKDIEYVWENIKNTVSKILNDSYLSDSYDVITKNSVFKLHQTTDGDVIINKYSKFNQTWFFDLQNINNPWYISQERIWDLYIYQRPITLFTALLEFIYKYSDNNLISDIKTIYNIQWRIPHATDALDINNFTIWNFERRLEDTESYTYDMWLSFYNKDKYIFIEVTNDWINVKIIWKDEKEDNILKIYPDEVLALLKWLIQLPWRSFAEMRAVLDVFLGKYNNN